MLTPEAERESMAGRKPIDAIVLFRMSFCRWLHLGQQVEYQVRDRLSFTRFLTSGIEDCIPDGTTLWLFREKLAQAGVVASDSWIGFDRYLGTVMSPAAVDEVDATIVQVPGHRPNPREENGRSKWPNPSAWRETDRDRRRWVARWTKARGGASHSSTTLMRMLSTRLIPAL